MSKYHNRKVSGKDGKFDSAKEWRYYEYLKKLQDEGKIENLQKQVRYEIVPAVYGTKTVQLKTKTAEKSYCIQRATYYIADFVYNDTETGDTHVVDVKSEITRKNPLYRLKKKLMRAVNNIEIQEV